MRRPILLSAPLLVLAVAACNQDTSAQRPAVQGNGGAVSGVTSADDPASPAAVATAVESRPLEGFSQQWGDGLAWVPDDAFAVLVVRPRRLLDSPWLADGEFVADLNREMGIDLALLETLVVCVAPKTSVPPGSPPEFEVTTALSFTEPIGLEGVIASFLGDCEQIELQRKRVFRQRDGGRAAYAAGERTVVMSTEASLAELLQTAPKSQAMK